MDADTLFVLSLICTLIVGVVLIVKGLEYIDWED